MDNNQDHLNTLRKIQNKPNSTQRELAKELGFSLGKLNYCLNALKEKGFVKMKNFSKNKAKLNYVYILTPKGISEKRAVWIHAIRNSLIPIAAGIGSTCGQRSCQR